ncbi:SgcJ/EcaC family oxidoreductase [Stackebrandtia nassauensis]|uniref:Putative secreted protein n=1 Tax=Stackebrandtia nassauensis (strain DSM 44728 / CIP 108903 / NRRL B-16338 / NBRC 102104 / LLR-40K-21) TaxID=446470 RepID=D3Q7Q6_STANL|nr:SgcJ/EcaC family oxidoreductase [Stackebrandtia nassauensis]ADD44398.1 putative secreted protein [Stackebrandtia nassauensis DSM 44728]
METPINQTLTELNDSWNRGDAEAYAAVFTPEADYITFFGQRLRGRQAIEDTHRFLFEGPLKGSRMTDSGEPTIRMLSPDVGFVIAVGGAILDDGTSLPDDRVSIVSLTAVRDGDRWRFASFQNTRRTQPPGAPR